MYIRSKTARRPLTARSTRDAEAHPHVACIQAINHKAETSCPVLGFLFLSVPIGPSVSVSGVMYMLYLDR